ncbi:MAG: hypothetical protein HQ481_16110 [Alphaproteobacteria bacterium]|nr:hypothetical protein [Alphaproteobacteria bacterium]
MTIPPEFKPDPNASLTGEFGTEAAQPKTEQDRRNDALRALGDKDNSERLLSGAGALAGTVRDDMNGKASDRAKRQAAEEKRKERYETAMYLAMLQQQIDDLNRQIADYDRRIADIEDRVFTPEERAMLDTLPADQRREKADAIMQQRLADKKVTQAEYDEWKRLQEARTEAKADLAEKQAELSAGTAKLHAAGGSVEIEGPKSQLDTQYTNLANQASKVGELEQRTMTLEGLTSYRGSDRNQRIDELVASLDEVTLDGLKVDSQVGDDVKVRIGILESKRLISSLDEFKGTPDYQLYVTQVINDLPKPVQDALRNESDLNAEITAALYEPFSDTLDGSNKAGVPPESEAELPGDKVRKADAMPPNNMPGPT